MAEVTTPDFLIEIATVPPGVIPQDATDKVVEGSSEQIKKITELARWIGDSVLLQIKNMAAPLSEFSLEFGINASGEAGLPLVTKGTLGANFKVAITWERTDL